MKTRGRFGLAHPLTHHVHITSYFLRQDHVRVMFCDASTIGKGVLQTVKEAQQPRFEL